MAGIGFELKDLFKERGLFHNIKGYFISSVITIGPTLLCIALIIGMQFLMKNMGENYSKIEFFVTIVIYCFALSLIISGGFALIASRFISDCYYNKTTDKILPSFFGIISIVLVIAFIVANFFPLPVSSKIAFVILLGELSVVWIETIYFSALKEYLGIFTSFLSGIAIIFVSFLLLVYIVKTGVFYAALVSVVLGFFIIMSLFLIRIVKEFYEGNFDYQENYEFITNFSKYPEIFVIGFTYYLGLYIHNFIFWISPNGTSVENCFRVAPFYDTALFYAFLSLLPATILFQVRTETNFYPKYKEYYSLCQKNGSVQDINVARSEMISTLNLEISYLLEIQLFISFTFIIFGIKILPLLGMNALTTDIFCILTLGNMSFSMMYIIIILMLYFDSRVQAMKVSLLFLALNFSFTIATLFLGESFYGYGFFAAALISVVFAYWKLKDFLKEIDYYTFASQPIFVKKNNGFFTRLYEQKIMKGEKRNEEG